LHHCEEAVVDLFAGVERICFAPYALADHDGYATTVRNRFAELGVEVLSLHEAPDPVSAIEESEGLFIGGGNTFRLLSNLYGQGLVEPIRRRALAGMPYLGTSAGSNVAGTTIRTTNDMPIVQPPSFDALALVDFQINPHYIDPDTSSTHQGETRDDRLREFHEENETPVVALREGAWLRVAGRSVTLEGAPGGRLFRRGHPILDCPDPTPLVPGALELPD